MTKPSKSDIDAILLERFPLLVIIEAAASIDSFQRRTNKSADIAAESKSDMVDLKASVDSMRAELEALPSSQLAELAATSRERQRVNAAKLAAERSAKVEADRFYNRSAAKADFVFWCKADFWTLDEAVALLLGRDPRFVTPEALMNELKQTTGLLRLGAPPKRAEFHRTYDGLRELMQRAEALAAPRLKPRAVLDWAGRTGAVAVPAQLEAALSAFEAATSSTKGAVASPQLAAACRSKGQEWTSEELDELRRYKSKHGTKVTAEKYGMSEARVRKLVPTEKAAPVARHPLDVWSHRSR